MDVIRMPFATSSVETLPICTLQSPRFEPVRIRKSLIESAVLTVTDEVVLFVSFCTTATLAAAIWWRTCAGTGGGPARVKKAMAMAQQAVFKFVQSYRRIRRERRRKVAVTPAPSLTPTNNLIQAAVLLEFGVEEV